jgi:hypothetical protein
MKSGGPSSHAVTFQIPTGDYFCRNSFSADDTFPHLLSKQVCYCIHQNIQMDPIMSHLNLISSLAFQTLAVCLRTTRFNIQKFYMVLT